jgi:hypothetical protein
MKRYCTSWLWPEVQKEFVFENGTTVFAKDYIDACIKIGRIDIRKYTLESFANSQWQMIFTEDVYVEFEAPDEYRAKLLGPYLLYLDKRIKDSLPV